MGEAGGPEKALLWRRDEGKGGNEAKAERSGREKEKIDRVGR